MFGGGDPFGNPFDHMRRQMQEMDNMMNGIMGNSFGMFNPPRRQQITNGHQNQQNMSQNNMLNPFSGFGFGGGIFGGMMQQMEHMQNHALNDPHSTVISQSTMISYDGNGQPKVVQNSTRKVGDVKETRRSVQNGNGAHMSVGHSIGERSHVIEKKRDKDGRIRQQQKFVGIDEDEAEAFNNEFKSRASRNMSNPFGSNRHDRRAIDNGRVKEGRKTESNAPIITVPDDEDDDDMPVPRRNGSRRQRRYVENDDDYVYSNSKNGPTIREITDEDDEDGSKRRKGLFGKFF